MRSPAESVRVTVHRRRISTARRAVSSNIAPQLCGGGAMHRSSAQIHQHFYSAINKLHKQVVRCAFRSVAYSNSKTTSNETVFSGCVARKLADSWSLSIVFGTKRLLFLVPKNAFTSEKQLKPIIVTITAPTTGPTSRTFDCFSDFFCSSGLFYFFIISVFYPNATTLYVRLLFKRNQIMLVASI